MEIIRLACIRPVLKDMEPGHPAPNVLELKLIEKLLQRSLLVLNDRHFYQGTCT